MNNLSELKRYLQLPNAALRMVSLEWFVNNQWVSIPVKPNLAEFRFVAKLQTNAVALATDGTDTGMSWLHFGKASEWAFDKSTNLAVNVSSGHRITYKWANVAIVEAVQNAN